MSFDSDLAGLSTPGAAVAARSLAARLLPKRDETAELINAHSFDLFEPLLSLASRRRLSRSGSSSRGPPGRAAARRLLRGVAACASPREALMMVLGALSNHSALPRAQCEALALLRSARRPAACAKHCAKHRTL